jgi:hypothetical protein
MAVFEAALTLERYSGDTVPVVAAGISLRFSAIFLEMIGSWPQDGGRFSCTGGHRRKT